MGVELTLGDYRVRIVEALGRGSYSVVWQGELLSGGEVAVKDVLCKSSELLRQSLFEVQLLQALERLPKMRLPRCLAYKVDVSEEGWHVRTAMERLPGEQLDDWLRSMTGGWLDCLHRGCALASRLVQQLGPTLHHLAGIAWHRDVNSHNVLISDVARHALDPTVAPDRAMFWLVDLGLAVDSRAWVHANGNWRRTDISGDCRYWPVSSWIMHLYGADYLASCPDFCRQYQTRLDVHGLGITGVELLCASALALRPSGTLTAEEQRWSNLLDAWKRYRATVDAWWAEIYSVFSVGGDFTPVHAWLLQEGAAEQVISLMAELRAALRACIQPGSQGCVLHVLAELIDERSSLELVDAAGLLQGRAAGTGGTGGTPDDRWQPEDRSRAELAKLMQKQAQLRGDIERLRLAKARQARRREPSRDDRR